MQQPPRGRDVPARLRKILLRGLSTKPSGSVSVDGRRCSPSSRGRRRDRCRKLAIALGALVLVAGAVVGGYALRSHDEQPAAPQAARGRSIAKR